VIAMIIIGITANVIIDTATIAETRTGNIVIGTTVGAIANATVTTAVVVTTPGADRIAWIAMTRETGAIPSAIRMELWWLVRTCS